MYGSQNYNFSPHLQAQNGNRNSIHGAFPQQMVVTMPFHPGLMAEMNGQLMNFNGGNPWAHHPLTQLSQMGQLPNSGGSAILPQFLFWNPTVMNNNSLQLQLQHYNAGISRNRRQRGKYPVPKVEPNSHNNFPRHTAQGLVAKESNTGQQEKSKESGIASANTSSQYDGSVGSRFTVQTNTIGQRVKHEPHMSRRMSSTLKSRNGLSHNGTFNQSPIKNEKQSFVLVAGNDSIVVDVEDKGNGPGVTIRQTPLWAEKPPTIKNEEPKSYADLNTKEDQKCNKQDEENQWETEEELQVKPTYMPRKGAIRRGVSENFIADMLPSTVRTVSRQLFKDRPLKRLDPNSTARSTKRVSMNSSINAPVRSNPAGSRSKKKARRISNVKDSAKVLREKRRKQPTIHEDGDVVFTATPVTASSCDDSKENPKKRKGSSFARSLSKIFNKTNKKKGMS